MTVNNIILTRLIAPEFDALVETAVDDPVEVIEAMLALACKAVDDPIKLAEALLAFADEAVAVAVTVATEAMLSAVTVAFVVGSAVLLFTGKVVV